MPSSTYSRNRRIIAATATGFARWLVSRRQEFRTHVVRDVWTIAKRFGAESIENIELADIPFLYDSIVESYIDDSQRAVIAALVRGLGCRTFLEIGTNLGRTTWTVARCNPELVLYTLDVAPSESPEETTFEIGQDDRVYFRPAGSCGEAFRDTPEARRITQLWGDSAKFDFSSLEGQIDFVYVDGAHTYEYVRADTINALRLLSPGGTVAWDDYTTGPGVYEYLVEQAPSLDRPVYHLIGTRMALYSRRDFVRRQARGKFPFG
jgi:predicted O-methyltransferase YrrM